MIMSMRNFVPSFRRDLVPERPINFEETAEPNNRDSNFVRNSVHEKDLKMINKTLTARSKRSYLLCFSVMMLLLLLLAAIVLYYNYKVLVPRTEIVDMVNETKADILVRVKETKDDIVGMIKDTKADIVGIVIKENADIVNKKIMKLSKEFEKLKAYNTKKKT